MAQGIISVLIAIVGVAALAVIFAPAARTSQVVAAGGDAFAGAITAAVAPVMNTASLNLRPVVGFN